MLGIIGGTGLYQMEGLSAHETRDVQTPFGNPSAPVIVGTYGGGNGSQQIAFLPRHGVHHELLPSEINFRANIWALKSLGVTTVLSVSATGSLAQEIAPGDLALPAQFMDMTRGRRQSTFFGDGLVAHISTAEPICASLADAMFRAAAEKEIKLHRGKTYACVEGPRLGTRAESRFLKSAGADLVGMTNVPEAFLAREAQICYATLAVVTDYDCWLDDPAQHASAEQVVALYRKNLGRVQSVIGQVLGQYREPEACPCRKSLQYAVMTPREKLSTAHQELLKVLLA